MREMLAGACVRHLESGLWLAEMYGVPSQLPRDAMYAATGSVYFGIGSTRAEALADLKQQVKRKETNHE